MLDQLAKTSLRTTANLSMQIPFDNSYARLGEPFSRAHEPVPVAAPSLLMLNDVLVTQLVLPIPWLRSDE